MYMLSVTFSDLDTIPPNLAGPTLYGMGYRRTTLTYVGEYNPRVAAGDQLVVMKNGKLWADPNDMYPLFGDDATWTIRPLPTSSRRP